jgi:predicted dienelactone hydrolase
MRRVLPVMPAVMLAVVILGACSSGSGGSKATSSTTAAAAKTAAPYAKTGPHAVGYTQLKLADGRRVVVWYPAEQGSKGAVQKIDVASFLSPQLQAQVPAEDRLLYPTSASLDAKPAKQKGGYPLVVFSHGFAGFPEQSSTLVTHLASWGFVVAAPEHVERSLAGLLGTASQGIAKSSDPDVLARTADLMTAESQGTGVLQGMVNPDQIVTGGHSAGAGAAYAFASADPRVKAFITYSVGFGGQGGPAPATPDQPGMVMLGTKDGIIPPSASVAVYDGMKSPKYLVKIPDAGHLVFSDICLIGKSKGGIVGIARAIKLPIPEQLLKLGSDGCESTHPPVDQAFAAINQLSVAFYRNALGLDPSPRGLDTAAVADLGGNVTVTSSR